MRIATILLLASLPAACATPSMPARYDAAAAGAAPVALTGEPDRWRHDPFEIIEIQLVGDTLEAAVRYPGGCARHDFTLLVSPVFMESYPVQVRASLAHDANADPCRALVGSRLRFDLGPLREAYRQAYNIESDVLHLHVERWPERVVYRF
jgi:hypothetical protein